MDYSKDCKIPLTTIKKPKKPWWKKNSTIDGWMDGTSGYAQFDGSSASARLLFTACPTIGR
jgi:hypothetical protein